jgi:hypothetical protein
MRRREFIALFIGGATGWPLAARAQRPSVPAIGFLGLGTLDQARRVFALNSRGLGEAGYVEGRNLSAQLRFADYHADRLPALANELAQAGVAAIITGPGPATSAIRAATTSIPIVFFTGFAPVASGLVASLNRPGANVTGIFTLNPAKPAHLPVQQVRKFELVIKLRTAKGAWPHSALDAAHPRRRGDRAASTSLPWYFSGPRAISDVRPQHMPNRRPQRPSIHPFTL